MFGVQSLLRSNRQILKNVIQQRNMSVIATPARNKISKAEVVVLGSLMVLGWSAVPVWVLVNIKHYRDKE